MEECCWKWNEMLKSGHLFSDVMPRVIAGGFQEIFLAEEYFQPANKKRAKEMLEAGHLRKVREHRESGTINMTILHLPSAQQNTFLFFQVKSTFEGSAFRK